MQPQQFCIDFTRLDDQVADLALVDELCLEHALALRRHRLHELGPVTHDSDDSASARRSVWLTNRLA